MVIWIIGLSGSGKTTLGERVVALAKRRGRTVAFLDGDALREAFGNDLGHSLPDRKQNADRICRLCALLDRQGIHVVCAILSLFQESRNWNRRNLSCYHEVFIDAPMNVLVARDAKGLYRRALEGKTRDVAGVDIPFAAPGSPDLVIDNCGPIEDLLSHAEAIAKLFEAS